MNVHVWVPQIAAFGGGIGAFSRELAAGLCDLGHDLQLLSKTDRPGTWEGLPLWGAGGFPSGLRAAAFSGGVIARCWRDRPDRIISTHLNFGPIAFAANRAVGTPFTLVAHGVDVHPGLSTARVAALRLADRLLAVSAWTRERLLKLGGIDGSRIFVLPNTVDERRFTVGPRPERLARRYEIKENERVVLTVSRLDRRDRFTGNSAGPLDHAANWRPMAYKGYERVLQALPAVRAACGQVRYVVAGMGDDQPRIERKVRELGLEQSVTFAGFVPDEELADHFRLADVFAMPSTGEGFGIVFLEAMACGVPVLAGNVDGSVDALDGGRLGKLVDPNDVHAIEEGLIALLGRSGPELWFDRHALHDAVTKRFGRHAFRETLRTLYP